MEVSVVSPRERRILTGYYVVKCQMIPYKKNDTALSIRSQRLATTSVAPNCTCPSKNRAIHQGSKWLHYSSILCGLLLSKSCSCAPCSSPAQPIITSSLLFPLWSDMSSCGRTCQPQMMLHWYAFLVAYANKLTSAEHLYTNLCSLSHISILLHSPSSPPMPRYPTFHQMSLQWTRNNWRCMYACVFHI